MKNMKVSMKLLISFMILLAMAVITGAVGILGMSSINNADDLLYKSNVLAISAMADFRETYQNERTQLRSMILETGDKSAVQKIINEFAVMEQTIKDAMALYENTITNVADETSYYNAKEAYLGNYAAAKQEIFEAALAGDQELAYQRLKDAAQIVAPIVEGLQISANHNEEWARETVDNNTGLYKNMVIIQIIWLAIEAAIAVILTLYISGMISKPLSAMTAFMNKAGSLGDISLTKEDEVIIAKYSQYKDESGQCLTSTVNFVKHITTISNELETVANGDLSIDIKLLSDKDVMGLSMKKMVDSLNNMFGEIFQSTAQVSTGSRQIADGAQMLAQGSTEQASAVQQLSSSISEIAEKTKSNAEMATKAANLAETIKNSAEKGSMQMDQMMGAVKEINQASQSINNVIKVIDDIAFQTNILALNAAVEAARAGQHGKGFAVVAEEVRSLAAKSAEAAKDTGGLIANSMEKAELGARIADETAASLAEIVTGINESNELVNEIARSSEEQSAGIRQINSGIELVTQVVQQNSATAEESAAASEEMSGQSDMLEQLVSQFKLRNEKSTMHMLSSVANAQQAYPSMPIHTNTDNDNEGFGKY